MTPKQIKKIIDENSEEKHFVEYGKGLFMTEDAIDDIAESLVKFNVNQQRELLIATLYGWKDYNEQGICIEDYVDEIVSNL